MQSPTILLTLLGNCPKWLIKRSQICPVMKTLNNAKVIDKTTLKDSDYKSTMKFDRQLHTKRNGNGKIIWFNPV